ncbi:MAG TPA: universal stress protein [Verrucomicrobiae bacterium]
MNLLKNILVGIDFSPCSRSALDQAVRLARQTRARLHAMYCLEYLTLDDRAWASHIPHEKLEADALARARSELRNWLAAAGAGDDASFRVEVGISIDWLLRQVKESAADLLVLGVNGSSMIPMGAGTLATKCLRKAPTKVLLVHEGHSGPFRRIVAGVDFSEASCAAVTQALRVATLDRCEVHFVHVFTGSWGRYALVPDAWEVDEATAAQYRQALETRLREFVGANAPPDCRFRVVQATSHGHGLAEYAREIQADLLVLGAKGRSNLGYVLLGSTVERLLRELPCSVLVARPTAAPVAASPPPAAEPK